MSDWAYDQALYEQEIGYESGAFKVEDMTLKMIVDDLKCIFLEGYIEDKFTPMIKSIVSQYEKGVILTSKQETALRIHLYDHLNKIYLNYGEE